LARLVLSIDTAGDACAVSVTRGHAERLFPMIAATLAEARVSRHALDLVAVCTGPGGFTGVRVGVSAARGLALGLGRPAVGADWFEVLAAEAAAAGDAVDRIALPAPRGGAHVADLRDGVATGPVRLVAAEALAPGEAEHWDAARAALGLPALARRAVAKLRATPAPPRPAPLYLRPPDAIAPAPALAATAL
jgi:tRNA threonylcarbamoyl adenosine modification protein YeaZ